MLTISKAEKCVSIRRIHVSASQSSHACPAQEWLHGRMDLELRFCLFVYLVEPLAAQTRDSTWGIYGGQSDTECEFSPSIIAPFWQLNSTTPPDLYPLKCWSYYKDKRAKNRNFRRKKCNFLHNILMFFVFKYLRLCSENISYEHSIEHGSWEND